MNVVFQINGKEQLNQMIERLRSIPSVIDIERTTG